MDKLREAQLKAANAVTASNQLSQPVDERLNMSISFMEQAITALSAEVARLREKAGLPASP